MTDKTTENPGKPERGRPPKGWKVRFIDALKTTGNVLASCRHASVHRSWAYTVRARDPKFFEEWENAIQESCDLMILEAQRRGMKGTKEPVYYLGKKIGEVTKYSDNLLMFLIKGIRPETYRENYNVAQASTPAGPPGQITVNVNGHIAPLERTSVGDDDRTTE